MFLISLQAIAPEAVVSVKLPTSTVSDTTASALSSDEMRDIWNARIVNLVFDDVATLIASRPLSKGIFGNHINRDIGI